MGMEEGRAKNGDVFAYWNGLELQKVNVIATEQRHRHQFIVLWPIDFFWTGPKSDRPATCIRFCSADSLVSALGRKVIPQRHQFGVVRLTRFSALGRKATPPRHQFGFVRLIRFPALHRKAIAQRHEFGLVQLIRSSALGRKAIDPRGHRFGFVRLIRFPALGRKRDRLATSIRFCSTDSLFCIGQKSDPRATSIRFCSADSLSWKEKRSPSDINSVLFS